jgi:hypothetical protein
MNTGKRVQESIHEQLPFLQSWSGSDCGAVFGGVGPVRWDTTKWCFSSYLARDSMGIPRSAVGVDAEMSAVRGGVRCAIHRRGCFGFDRAVDSDSPGGALFDFASVSGCQILASSIHVARISLFFLTMIRGKTGAAVTRLIRPVPVREALPFI